MVPAIGLEKATAAVLVPLHTVWLLMLFTVGAGFTVMVKELVGPVQPLAVGVTVTVAITGALPVLVAVKEAMFPLPEAARPMEASLFVHAKVVPVTVLVKFTAVVLALPHRVWLVILSAVGVGFTVMVNELVGPVQPLAVGVTVMVAVTGAVPAFTPLKAAMFPLPEAARPMVASLLVQAKVVPVTGLPKFMAVVEAPLHMV